MKECKKVKFLGIDVAALDTDGLCQKIIEFALDDVKRTVFYVNAHCTLLYLRDRKYMEILQKADLVYPDGFGVVLGARLWGYRIPGRSTAADFLPALCNEFTRLGIRIFLLGSKQGIAKQAASRLMEMAPGLEVVGTHCGYFITEETGKIIAKINNSRAHILIVGMGAPLQEKWVNEHADQINVSVLWGVGGLFNFISGATRRGPKWLLDNGFEWLCRLITEPGRLGKRYIIGNARFLICLFWNRFLMKRKIS